MPVNGTHADPFHLQRPSGESVLTHLEPSQ